MGSISAILRIQEVYNLSAHAIADGGLHQEKSSEDLGADECYELGIVSNDQGNYDNVIEWMKEALKRMSLPYEYNGALTKIDALEYLSWAEYKVGLQHRIQKIQKEEELGRGGGGGGGGGRWVAKNFRGVHNLVPYPQQKPDCTVALIKCLATIFYKTNPRNIINTLVLWPFQFN